MKEEIKLKMKFCYELDPVGKMYMNSGAIVDAKNIIQDIQYIQEDYCL